MLDMEASTIFADLLFAPHLVKPYTVIEGMTALP
jgi:hypothetical protein